MAFAVAGMGALAVSMGIGRFAATPVLPMMQVDAGLALADGGWLASANYLGNLVGAAAALAVRRPTPPAIRGGLLAVGVATLGMGFVHNFAAWIALRTLAGAATAWVLPLASAWALERLEPHRRPLLNAIVFAGFGVGIAVVGGFCLWLMRVNASSAVAWIGLGLLALAVSVLIWPVFDDVTGVERPRGGDARWDPDRVRLVACYGVFGLGYILPATFLPAMAREVVADPAVFGWSWPIFGAAAAGGTFAASDEVTGKPLPEGEVGALVVTPLFTNHVTPFLRWLSGDIVSLHHPEPDGHPFSVFPVLRHAHRTSGFFKVRGVNVNHTEFEDFMFRQAAVVDFRAELVTRDGLEGLRVLIEVTREADLAATAAAVAASVKRTFELTPEIQVLERGTLAREFEKSVKAPRFVDARA